MGPYVLRSIAAHYKLWDEGAQDSFEENLKQAPVTNIPSISTNCNCWYKDDGCEGSAIGGTGSCSPGQDVQILTCSPTSPLGCDPRPSFICQNDNNCCRTYYPQGCGKTPVGQTPPSTDCNYGQRIYATLCAALPVECNTDASCSPQCVGSTLFQNSITYCATGTSTPPTTGLTQNTAITYVNEPTQWSCDIHPSIPNCTYCPPTGATCQVYCNPPYILNSTATACVLGFTVAATSCSASTNLPASPGGCSPSSTISCDVGSCSSSISDACNCKPPGNYCNWSCYVVTNNQSFRTCVSSGTNITSVSVVPYGSPVTPSPPIPVINGGCGNPGEPSQMCAVSLTFS